MVYHRRLNSVKYGCYGFKPVYPIETSQMCNKKWQLVIISPNRNMDERFVTTKQDTKYHRCGLLGEPWDICNKFIEGGILVNFRRKLKRWESFLFNSHSEDCFMVNCKMQTIFFRFTMISIDHPLTKMYAPSMRRLKREEKVHLVQHYDMIHPLSMFSMYFNVISALILMFYFMAIPIIYPLTSKFIFTIMMIPCNGKFGGYVIIRPYKV